MNVCELLRTCVPVSVSCRLLSIRTDLRRTTRRTSSKPQRLYTSRCIAVTLMLFGSCKGGYFTCTRSFGVSHKLRWVLHMHKFMSNIYRLNAVKLLFYVMGDWYTLWAFFDFSSVVPVRWNVRALVLFVLCIVGILLVSQVELGFQLLEDVLVLKEYIQVFRTLLELLLLRNSVLAKNRKVQGIPHTDFSRLQLQNLPASMWYQCKYSDVYLVAWSFACILCRGYYRVCPTTKWSYSTCLPTPVRDSGFLVLEKLRLYSFCFSDLFWILKSI